MVRTTCGCCFDFVYIISFLNIKLMTRRRWYYVYIIQGPSKFTTYLILLLDDLDRRSGRGVVEVPFQSIEWSNWKFIYAKNTHFWGGGVVAYLASLFFPWRDLLTLHVGIGTFAHINSQRRHSRRVTKMCRLKREWEGTLYRGTNATITGICVKSKGKYSILNCSRMKAVLLCWDSLST